MSGPAAGPSGRAGSFGGAAGARDVTSSPILVDDDSSSGDEQHGSSACPIVIPDTWNGTTIMLPQMGDRPPRSNSPIIIPESWMGRPLLLPARPRRRRRARNGAGPAPRAASGQAAQRAASQPAPAAAAPPPPPVPEPAAEEEVMTEPSASANSQPVRGRGRGRGSRRGRGARGQSAAAASRGRGRGRGGRGGAAAAAMAMKAPGADPALLDKVQALVAGITAATAALRSAAKDVKPNVQTPAKTPNAKSAASRQEPVAGPSGMHSRGSTVGAEDAKAGVKKSPPSARKEKADCAPASPVAGPSRARSDGTGLPAVTVLPADGGDVTFGVLFCTAVGLQYYPGLLTVGGRPVRLTADPPPGRDVRLMTERGLTCGHLSRECGGALSPLLQDGLVRLEAVCVDHDMSTAELEVTVRGREHHRQQVTERLGAMGYELEEATATSPPPLPVPEEELYNPSKPGRSGAGGAGPPDRTLVAPRDAGEAVNERWEAVQRALKEVEPCAAVASRMYPHQKQALGWMMAREAAGAVARGPHAVCGGILADDMGLGKTLQVIALILTHFKGGRPLAVPVPWRKRVPPVPLALNVPPPKPVAVTPAAQLRSPKVDWGDIVARLKAECQSASPATASGSGAKCDDDDFSISERRSRIKRKPARYIDSDESDADEPPPGGKRAKAEQEGAKPESAEAKTESADVKAEPKEMKPEPIEIADGPSGSAPDAAILIDSDEDLLDDTPAKPAGGAADAAQKQATPGPGGAAAAAGGGDSEYIPVPPSYCDHDGRSGWPGPRTTLIVCPLSVMENWETQLEQHVHRNVHLRVRSYHGVRRSAAELDEADVVLTTYATLGRELDRGDDSPLLRRHFLRVVLDEGHTIRNPASCMARAAFELRAERRWVLTGTPVQNRLKDLWSLMRFLRLEPYASQRPLWRSELEQPVLRGSARAVEKLQNLMATVALRRLKEQRVDGRPIVTLPPRNVYIQHVAMTGEQRRKYEQLENQFRCGVVRFIQDGTIVRRQVQIMVMILRLRQLCCHPALVPEHEFGTPEPPAEGVEIGPEERQRLVSALTEMLQSGADEECPVCFEPLRQPVITVCSHVFCRPCVGRLMAAPAEPRGPLIDLAGGAAGGEGAMCPLCRGPLRAGQLVEVTDEELQRDGGEKEKDKDTSSDGDGDGPADDVLSAKICSLMEGIRAMRTEDAATKALVVSQFTKLLDRVEGPLRAAGVPFCRLDGSMPVLARRRAMAQLAQTVPGAPCVMLLSLRAGGEGINLTAASRVFLLDPAWNPAIEEQCFDRCHRLGQTRPVTVVKLVARDSIEERMLALQDKKRELMTSTFGGVGLTAEQRRVQFIDNMRTLFNL